MAKILISGGTGLIGRHLCKNLQERGFDVAVLSRTRKSEEKWTTYSWDINNYIIDKEAIATTDYIIHLSGSSVGEKRWTRRRKQEIIDSRIKSGQLIIDEIKKQNKSIKAFISSSAVGYYGTLTSDQIFNETDPPGDGFLGQTCRKWEHIADKFQDAGIRTVKIRTGIVLSDQGGALSKMAMPIKRGFGSPIGSGKQYIPWIHIEDLCNIYIKAIEDEQIMGAYNAVAPEHVNNKEFTQALARTLEKRLWFPSVPAFFMKLIFGKMSQILLEGSRVSSQKIQDEGYNFLYPGLESALKHTLLNKVN